VISWVTVALSIEIAMFVDLLVWLVTIWSVAAAVKEHALERLGVITDANGLCYTFGESWVNFVEDSQLLANNVMFLQFLM